MPSFDEMSAAVHDHLVNDTAADVARFPRLPVEHRAVHASPAKALVELSRDALILVVGSPGLGGFAGLVLGSVSEQCVRHAACSVLVVRRRPQSAAPRARLPSIRTIATSSRLSFAFLSSMS